MEAMETKTLTTRQLLLMSVTAGICVANVYYSQPILKEIAASFAIDEKSAGTISVLSQAGYGLGLFFLTPLGDKIERKKLILALQVCLIIALLSFTFAANIYALYISSLAIGIFAVAAQVILPMAASLVTENRGKIVGIIFTGILAGVLMARVFSGYIAELLNWRYVFGISAGMVFITTVLMQIDFPSHKERFEGNYAKLLGSTLFQIKRFPLLRRTALTGALLFGTLSSFWTTLTFHLTGAPFNFRSDSIGLFGLLAAGGAMLVPVFGKLADKKNNPNLSLIITISMVLLSIICLKVFPFSIAALWVSVLLLDIGVQASQVTNIALIYTLDTQANSRINTVYMTCYFLGGAGGAYAGLVSWQYGAWNAVTMQMGVFTVLALFLVIFNFRRKTAQPVAPSAAVPATEPATAATPTS
jgi:predicted MFS family arabinose efflux permease